MEKKEYIKPEMEVMIIEVQLQMMTTSPGTEPGFGGGDIEADDSEVLTNRRRRGEWGDLWADTK